MEVLQAVNTVLDINQKFEATDYPYGRLRTSKYFSIEFNSKHGFRSVEQTINPKNGRLNAPKKATYNNGLCFLIQEAETGYYKFRAFNVFGTEDIKKLCDYIIKHHKELNLTNEMYKYLGGLFYAVYQHSFKWCVSDHYLADGATSEQVKDIFQPVVNASAEMFKTGDFLIDKCILDFEALEPLQKNR